MDGGRRPSVISSRASSRITKDHLRHLRMISSAESARGSCGWWSAPIRSQQPGVQQDHERPVCGISRVSCGSWSAPSAVSSRASMRNRERHPSAESAGFLVDRGQRPSAVSSRASSRITKTICGISRVFLWIVVGAHPQSAAGRPARSRRVSADDSAESADVSCGSWSAPIRSQQPGVQQEDHERPSAESAEFLADRGRRPSAVSSRASSRTRTRPICGIRSSVTRLGIVVGAPSAVSSLGVQQDRRPSSSPVCGISRACSCGSWSAPIPVEQPVSRPAGSTQRPICGISRVSGDRGRRRIRGPQPDAPC